MGYTTDFSLDVQRVSKDAIDTPICKHIFESKFCPECGKGTEMKTISQQIESTLYKIADYEFLFQEAVKWYDWKKDVKAVSLQFPKALIIITGNGEDYPDMWRAYFLNGKVQDERAVITYPEFDESKLMEIK